jgi:hypothetical protein
MADSLEVAAIEDAYHERIQLLFTGLATNLGDKQKTEQQCVDMFKTGFNIAKKARHLALAAVGAAPGA